MSSLKGSDALQPKLESLDGAREHAFIVPLKRIHDGPEVSFFLTSLAYRDIVTFILQLNRSMIPRKVQDDSQRSKVNVWELTPDSGTDIPPFPPEIIGLRNLLRKLDDYITEMPPDPGPRRFGNISFRKWSQLVEDRIDSLLEEHIPANVLHFPASGGADEPTARDEIKAYLLGSFGSPPRLDYGTGHELTFLAFLGCLWKLGAFPDAESGVRERHIILGVFEPYLALIRHLIKIYTLEPAGSHGVWGLDDNSFLPYLFGSAQLAPAISESDATPTEGSLPDAPEPASVAKVNIVEKERKTNMYFSAISFIHDVKRGPFWEHSPMLYDISGIKQGWGKINKGMIKMYNAEVLAKFPVVQHFPFGSLFKWEKDPNALPPPTTTHTVSQPLRNPLGQGSGPPLPAGPVGTAAPWAQTTKKPPSGMVGGVTRAPWATSRPPPRTQNALPPTTEIPSAVQDVGPGPRHGQLRTKASGADRDSKAGSN